MIEKREIYKIFNPFLWECETFYLTYNKRTNKLEFNGKELNDNSYNLDNVFIVWDGKDHDYYSAHPKRYVDVYRSNSDKPEKGYVFVGKEENGNLPYYYKRKEPYDMLITKQYVVFGKTGEEVLKQLCQMRDEFDYAGWRISLNDRHPFTHFTVTNNNVKIIIKSCIVDAHVMDEWDNCWISNEVGDKAIQDIIIPLSISDTPEIHFF